MGRGYAYGARLRARLVTSTPRKGTPRNMDLVMCARLVIGLVTFVMFITRPNHVTRPRNIPTTPGVSSQALSRADGGFGVPD